MQKRTNLRLSLVFFLYLGLLKDLGTQRRTSPK